jgi:RimJ/RimL family protein N-acetyltransferase
MHKKMRNNDIETKLEGRHLILSPFSIPNIHKDYLSWLNDSEVNQYSRRRNKTISREDAVDFLNNLKKGERIFGIYLKDQQKHIGNIQYSPNETLPGVGEIRILMGEKKVWGRGYGTEAIYILSKSLFVDDDLYRLEANTINPSFSRCMDKLGWKLEGQMRERISQEGQRHDFLLYGILKKEFRVIDQYEPQVAGECIK